MASTKYDLQLMQILSSYPMGGPILIGALAVYVQSQVDLARSRGIDDVAAQHCDQLHDSPPEGLVCKACYDTVCRSRFQSQIEAEREAERSRT